jgi:tetratricopeptide (TPR) repeat protein
MKIQKIAPFYLFLLVGLMLSNTPLFAQSELNEFQEKELKSAFIEGNKQKILENWDEAEEQFRKALKIYPDHAASKYELARLYKQQGRFDDAVLLVEEAIETDRKNEWYYLLLADLYRQNRQYEEVAGVFQKMIETFPDKLDYRYDLAGMLIILGDSKAAIDVYNEIEAVIGINEDISLKKRSLYANLGKPRKAMAEVEALVEAYPYNTRYLQILAEFYVDNGDYEKALEMYNRVVELAPDDPYIHISLSDLYRKKGNPEKAHEELKLGFANPELNLDSKIQILITYYTFDQLFNEKKEQAIELSEILNDTHPGDPRSMSLYADLLYRSGELEKSLEIITEVLEIDESNYGIWEQKLFIENELRRNQQLAETSTSAMELFPMQPLPYLFNGFANYQLKDYEAARKSLEMGSKLVVGNDRLQAQFYSTLGDIYNQLEDHQKSDENYELALTLNPTDAYVLNNFSYYLSLRGENLEKAREMAKRANDIEPNSPSFMDTYGWVLYKLGEYQEAEIWVKKALDHPDEDGAVLLEHYGDILYKLNRKTEALEYWQKAKDMGGEASEFLEKKINEQKLFE